MNSFRTEIFPEKTDFSLNHSDGVVLMGSCFAENIGAIMNRYKFRIEMNSHGIIFNPESLALAIEDVISIRQYAAEELVMNNNSYHSLVHHGRFSGPIPEDVIQEINGRIRLAHVNLRNAKVILITFGSAWAYRYLKSGQVVANCHKIPGNEFVKSILVHQEIDARWNAVFSKLFLFNPDIKVVLTISPVRHWRDGVTENQLSKANLILAANSLVQEFPNVHYFPAYEIVLDDLRDYRFYNEDMIHPDHVATRYVWQKFEQWCIDLKTRHLLEKMEPLLRFIEHRPMKISNEIHEEMVRIKQAEIAGLISRSIAG